MIAVIPQLDCASTWELSSYAKLSSRLAAENLGENPGRTDHNRF
jgi:hypothetical protein